MDRRPLVPAFGKVRRQRHHLVEIEIGAIEIVLAQGIETACHQQVDAGTVGIEPDGADGLLEGASLAGASGRSQTFEQNVEHFLTRHRCIIAVGRGARQGLRQTGFGMQPGRHDQQRAQQKSKQSAPHGCSLNC